MIINIDGLDVIFPYDYIYPEQYHYMSDLKLVIDQQGPCLLEMPSGTGKTVSLLSLIVSYILSPAGSGRKLIYCSRTVPEIEKALLELQRLMDFRANKHFNGQKEQFLALGLSSRKNLCVNPDVMKEKYGKAVDAKCRSLTASWVRNQSGPPKRTSQTRAKVTLHQTRTRTNTSSHTSPTSSSNSQLSYSSHSDVDLEDISSRNHVCSFYEGLEGNDSSEHPKLFPPGVYTIDELRDWGQRNGICPYFLSRRMMGQANVIIYSYHYLLDPKVAELVSKDLPRDSIIVFDEAHNIDNVCIESLSVDITRKILDASTSCLSQLSDRIEQIKVSDAEKLRSEYEMLVEGLRIAVDQRDTNQFLGNPVLPNDVIEGAVPGNIRKAEHFVAFLRRFVEYLKTRLRVQHVVAETPASMLQHLRETTCIERKPLQYACLSILQRFCSERLSSLVRTLEITDIDKFSELSKVAMFGTLVATYAKGFMLILEPFESDTSTVSNPVFHLTCLDASYAMTPVFKRFSTVIITSGTLSPLDMYPQILQFTPILSKSYPMSLTRDCFLPLVITRGSDQVAISSKFEVRNEPAVVRNFGQILIQLSSTVPDGLVCFFPSYLYMESIVSMWNGMKLLDEVWRHKLIFVETPDATETAIALENYRAACDNGRGAVLLSVARGKVSEGIDFDHNYGRAVVMFGIPYQYTESRPLKARLEYLRNEFNVRENEFLTFDAIRHAAQCVGRVLRGKTDYGLMIFADKRYARADKRSKLPPWMSHKFNEATINCSTDMAISTARQFLRVMAQPFEEASQLGSSLWTIEHVNQYVKQQLQLHAMEVNLVDEVSVAVGEEYMESQQLCQQCSHPRLLSDHHLSHQNDLHTSQWWYDTQSGTASIYLQMSTGLNQPSIEGGMIMINASAYAPVSQHATVLLQVPIIGKHRVSFDHKDWVFDDLMVHSVEQQLEIRLVPLDKSNSYQGVPLPSVYHPPTPNAPAGYTTVTWTARSPRQYFQTRHEFSLFQLLYNPMLIMPIMSLGLVMLLPKLTAMLDETKDQDDQNQLQDQSSQLTKLFKSL